MRVGKTTENVKERVNEDPVNTTQAEGFASIVETFGKQGNSYAVVSHTTMKPVYRDHQHRRTTCLQRPPTQKDHLSTETTNTEGPPVYRDHQHRRTTCLQRPPTQKDHLSTETTAGWSKDHLSTETTAGWSKDHLSTETTAGWSVNYFSNT